MQLAKERTVERLLVPPTPLEQLAQWRAKVAARYSGPPPAPAPREPKKR